MTCFRSVRGTRCLPDKDTSVHIKPDTCSGSGSGSGELLLSQLLDEHGDGRGMSSYFLDEGVVVLPLWLQADLEPRGDPSINLLHTHLTGQTSDLMGVAHAIGAGLSCTFLVIGQHCASMLMLALGSLWQSRGTTSL